MLRFADAAAGAANLLANWKCNARPGQKLICNTSRNAGDFDLAKIKGDNKARSAGCLQLFSLSFSLQAAPRPRCKLHLQCRIVLRAAFAAQRLKIADKQQPQQQQQTTS